MRTRDAISRSCSVSCETVVSQRMTLFTKVLGGVSAMLTQACAMVSLEWTGVPVVSSDISSPRTAPDGQALNTAGVCPTPTQLQCGTSSAAEGRCFWPPDGGAPSAPGLGQLQPLLHGGALPDAARVARQVLRHGVAVGDQALKHGRQVDVGDAVGAGDGAALLQNRRCDAQQ